MTEHQERYDDDDDDRPSRRRRCGGGSMACHFIRGKKRWQEENASR